MFATAEMSRLTVAAPVDKMEDVLRVCASLSCVHIEEYGQFQDGIGVGRALSTEGANQTSALLTKVRAVLSAVSAVNTDGPVPAAKAKALAETFEAKIDDALAYLDTIRDSEASISTLNDQLQVLKRLAPLEIPLELMGGFDGLEVYVGETARASKAKSVFAALGTEILLHSAPGVVAVACQTQHAAEVQICLAELGAKAVQIPAGEGSPVKKLNDVTSEITSLENTIASTQEALDAWVDRNARSLVALSEFLTREDAIYTAPTLVAVSDQAFALDGWVPTSQGEMVKSKLGKVASHVSVEAYVDPHHAHGDHGDSSPDVAKELVMLSDYLLRTKQSIFQFFKSMDLDDSGKIDSYEFQQALKSANVADLPPWDVGPLVQAMDLDGDGKINLPELDISLTMIRAMPASDEHHEEPMPPIQFENGKATQPYELLVDLVGRPKYGTFEPSMLIMMTFPLIYGMILGDWGYGLILVLLSLWLGSKPFAVDPL
ncbi:MAG TPA: hypothetical protein HA356_03000, partial [Candidatus Poseidoniaceae archaeon]